jgi:amino acid permease
MDYKSIPSWLYSLILCIVLVSGYKFINRNKKDDSNGKYLILFIVLFILGFLGFSYVIEKKNYLTMSLPSKSQNGGSQSSFQNSNPKMELDSGLPDF